MNKIVLFSLYGWNKSFKEYLLNKGISPSKYQIFKEKKKIFFSKREIIKRELIVFAKILLILPKLRNKKIFCTGGHYALCFFSKVFFLLLGKNHRIYLYDFYLHDMEKNKLVLLIIRFLFSNKNILLIVQSPREKEFYEQLTNGKTLVKFVPFCSDGFFFDDSKVSIKMNYEYFFSGGYTNRDYAVIIEVAKRHPNINFILAVSKLNKEQCFETLPINVQLFCDIKRIDFYSLVARAFAVIIPLKNDVGSSGQMLCLNAMNYKKPIIYTNISSVNYYFNEESGIPYTLSDDHSLDKAVEKLLDDKNEAIRIGKNGYDYYKAKFTEEKRNQMLFSIIEG
jgi:glycosyltransferase involved in cell wall biosynthesis